MIEQIFQYKIDRNIRRIYQQIKAENYRLMNFKNNDSSQNATTSVKTSKQDNKKNKIRSFSKFNLIRNLSQQKLDSSVFKRKNKKVDFISRINPIGLKGECKKSNNIHECEKNNNIREKMNKEYHNEKFLKKINIEKNASMQMSRQLQQNQIQSEKKSINPYVQDHLTLEKEYKCNFNANTNTNSTSYEKIKNKKIPNNKKQQMQELECELSEKHIKNNQNSFNYYKIVRDYKRRNNNRIRSYSNDSYNSNYKQKQKLYRHNRIASLNEDSQEFLSRKQIQSINSQNSNKMLCQLSLKKHNLIMKESIMNRRPQSVTLINSQDQQEYFPIHHQDDEKRQSKLAFKFTIYTKKIQKLQNEVLKYRKLYFNSISQSKKIELAHIQQKRKFQLQRQVYKNQIDGLKKKLQAINQYNNNNKNIGHLYSYNEYNTSEDINKCMSSSKMIAQEEKQSSLMLMTMKKQLHNKQSQNQSQVQHTNKKVSFPSLLGESHYYQHLAIGVAVNQQNSINPSSSLSSNLSLNSKINHQSSQSQTNANIIQSNKQNSKEQKFKQRSYPLSCLKGNKTIYYQY